ncbi:Transgelin [Kluyveromyces marxianus]|uniref:Transgelin n=2 Tax=Kluyveromyces marxianus TaxID=4911 RepID=W0T6N4_KLUMD|nr:transgelin [Kluyveromyces marxianus DMKU3-1042]KAG0670771.1 calponin [Kluyveromyces marxianus]KAG0678745.1 calponin [Kluyveromyces marxianus]QGN15005.1 transgelin [Kluyveromyces marxianus]BAO39282.1 transgelin [Kluyveromyces marxianus DMKU3-1042]BAP70794.1 transgelin [Kluyveromyces marxianus]
MSYGVYGIKADVTSLDEDLKELRSKKFNNKDIEEIKSWIFKVIGEPEPQGRLTESLKDGTVLCKLANTLSEADTGKVNLIKWKNSSISFVQMEQIAMFLQFARQYGVPEDELFQTVDLYEEKDPAIVYQTLKSLSRYANTKHPDIFPVIGPQLSTKRPRPPVKDKPSHLKNTGWSTIEYGYMKGANQSTEGVVFGHKRDITMNQ